MRARVPAPTERVVGAQVVSKRLDMLPTLTLAEVASPGFEPLRTVMRAIHTPAELGEVSTTVELPPSLPLTVVASLSQSTKSCLLLRGGYV